jgi:hypothetical protein
LKKKKHLVEFKPGGLHEKQFESWELYQHEGRGKSDKMAVRSVLQNAYLLQVSIQINNSKYKFPIVAIMIMGTVGLSPELKLPVTGPSLRRFLKSSRVLL